MSINPNDLTPDPAYRPANKDDDGDYLWVLSDQRPDGSYGVTIQFDQNRSMALDAKECMAYARYIERACERADYDAATLRQLNGQLNLPFDETLATVLEIRDQREPLGSFKMVTLEAGITNDGTPERPKIRPFITCRLDGQDYAQYEVEAARQHAVAVLGALETAELDTVYHRYLTERIGVNDNVARQVIQSLGQFR